MDDHHDGPYGRAERLPIPDVPTAAQTVDHWLITAPAFHPVWSQYTLACVRLDDLPGWPAPHHQFEGTTHELLVVALNPEHGPYDRAAMDGYAQRGGGLPYLTPVNIVQQHIATDDEMRQLCWLAARSVVHGYLWPETGDAPGLIRDAWLTSMVRTLAHIRGEPHDSGLGHRCRP